MKISVISDIHVHPKNEKSINTLREFCRNDVVRNSDLVVFLGDIFDLCVYDFDQYKLIYSSALIEIETLLKSGVEVVFVEGNHDFRINSLFKNWTKIYKFHYFDNGFYLHIGREVFSFFHGDTIEIENRFYRIYRSLIKNKFISKFYKSIVGFEKTWSLGLFLLNRSHERHEKYSLSYNSDEVLTKFRKSADLYFKSSSSKYLICGHSHVKDFYENNGRTYLNNGFAQAEKTFIYYENEFKFLEI